MRFVGGEGELPLSESFATCSKWPNRAFRSGSARGVGKNLRVGQ